MLSLLLCSSAFALTHDSASIAAVEGWTADGALVYDLNRYDSYAPEEVEDAGDLEDGVVHHVIVQRGDQVEHDWVTGSELPAFPSAKAPASQEAEWKAWRADHPLTPATHGASGPKGVRVDVSDPSGQTEVTTPDWTISRSMDDEGDQQVVVALSNAGKGTWRVDTFDPATPVWSSSTSSTVEAWWSPDGQWVAVIYEAPSQMTMRGTVFGHAEVDLVRASPLVSVLAPKSLGEPVAKKVAAAIADLGQIETGEAKAERPASVVYFAPGFETQAAAVAAKVPGGATTEPFSWDAHQHLVVAVGASAK